MDGLQPDRDDLKQKTDVRKIANVLLVCFSLTACGGLEIRGGVGSSGVRIATQVTMPVTPGYRNSTTVEVKPGDTVYGLSQEFNVSTHDVIIVNNLRPPYLLRVGQRLIMPRGTVHVVKSGETLYSITNMYDANVYEIARANNIGPPYTIFVGQQIRIPGTVKIPSGRTTAQSAGTTTTTTVTPAPTTKPAAGSTATNGVGAIESASLPVPSPKPPAPTKAVPTPPAESGRGFLWPARGKIISGFGPKAQGLHNDGINIAAPEGAPISAAENGVVAYAGNELRGFGNLILIKHANGYITAYAHASKILVERGETVARGQTIALVGESGSVTSPQLHFEVRRGKIPLNPRKYLPPSAA